MKSPRRATRLPRWQEYAVYLTLGALFVTGLLWLGLDQWARVETDFGPEHHPTQRWTLIAHGVAAYLFLVVGGAMIPIHVKLGWHLKRNRGSGLVLGLTAILLAGSGVGLYYIGAEAMRASASLMHWLVGILVIPALIVHAVRGLRG